MSRPLQLAALYRSGLCVWAFRPARMADGRTALSQHRRRPAPRRRARRRVGVFFATSVAAVIAIASGALFAVHGFGTSRYDPVAEAAAAISVSHSAALLERERQHLILDSASRTMNLVGAPKVASNPVSAGGAAVPAAAAAGVSGAAPGASMPAPNPGSAESIAYNMLPSFGFDPKTQYSCLYQMWMRESGWNYQAENASGAYGIPQALPGSKMASAGADWATNPATQIRWGLGYIKSVYGTPCGAWGFWQAHSWY